MHVVECSVSGQPGIIVCSEGCSRRRILEALRQCDSKLSQVIVVHLAQTSDPWSELAAGADDVQCWDGRVDVVYAKLRRKLEIDELLGSPEVTDLVVGDSPALRHALRELVVAARFGTGPILILGETGTGKEVAARIAHRVRPVGNRTGQLVVVDCTTIVPGLLGSELFGHEKGAFTGAVSARSGACAVADGGTLFLDEVGELPLELQPELMRVVQEGNFKHVGGDRWQHSSFRLLCATNRDLMQDVHSGRFRSDLYYRIASATIQLPPLRDRVSDILPLFTHFYAAARSGQVNTPEVDPAVIRVLRNRDYPGNLRDLRQLAFRVAARHVGDGPITPGDLPPQDRPVAMCGESTDDGSSADLAAAVRQAIARGVTLRALRDEVSNVAVDSALTESGGNVRAAAALLGVTDRAIQQRRARDRKAAASP